MENLEDYIGSIEEISQDDFKIYRDHWDSLVHPTGSLGDLEEIGIKTCAILGELPSGPPKKACLVMAADNGITEEDVSSSPKILTWLLAEQMIVGTTGVCALAEDAGADMAVVDLGIEGSKDLPGLIRRKISEGTKNFMVEDAMTLDEARQAIMVGIEVAEDYIKNGYQVLGTGELGIGNTTTSAALIRALTEACEDEVVGLGSGVTSQQLDNKLRVVRDCTRLRGTDPNSPIDCLAKVGGYDIGAIAGVFLACGKNKVVGVIDGVISMAGALLAYRLNPNVASYLIASHQPKEKASQLVLEELGIKAYLDLSMRLGEGSGCPLLFKLIDSSLYCMNHMTRFEDTDIRNTLVNIRDKK